MSNFLGYSEIQLHNFFANKPDAVFYDIGARHGEFSVPLAEKCNIVAFEPSVDNYNILVNNSKQFGDRFKSFNIALSESEFECDTNFKDCDKNKYQHITYRKLDTFVQNNNLPLPTYVKIDVEGMESIILKTMHFIFEKKIPVYCEVHNDRKIWGNQDYDNNPSFKTPDKGGFDFNSLKEYDYNVYSKIHSWDGMYTILLDKNSDYNPKEPSHYGMFFV